MDVRSMLLPTDVIPVDMILGVFSILALALLVLLAVTLSTAPEYFTAPKYLNLFNDALQEGIRAGDAYIDCAKRLQDAIRNPSAEMQEYEWSEVHKYVEESTQRVRVLIEGLAVINTGLEQGDYGKITKERWLMAEGPLTRAIETIYVEQANIDRLAWQIAYGDNYMEALKTTVSDTARWASVLRGLVSPREHGMLIAAETGMMRLSRQLEQERDISFARASNELARARYLIRQIEKTYQP